MRRNLWWALCAVVLVHSGAEAFYRTAGKVILDNAGNTFVARGLVLSGWLNPEAYQIKINKTFPRPINSFSDIDNRMRQILGNNADVDNFWSVYRSRFLTEADLASFAARGVNAIRLPFNYRLLSPKDQPGVYLDSGFALLDQAIAWCKAHNLAVILDMHSCPGGQSHDPYADPEYTYWYYDSGQQQWLERGVAVLWEYNQAYFNQTGRTPAFNKQRTADIWQVIANRYKNETAILGYELMNEPYYYASSGVTDTDLRNALIQITNSIRAVDTNHIVMVEGNLFAELIGGLTPPWDSNQVIAFHRYWRQTGYQDGRVQEYLNARDTYNVPLFMTESGENSNGWFYEMSTLMTGNGIGWTWWGFKKVTDIATAYSAPISADYQYVIDHFRDVPVDPVRARKGLMELADSVGTSNCAFEPGYFASLLDPQFATTPKPRATVTLPGTLAAANYDVGYQGVASWDTVYENTVYQGPPWNNGWVYRNDGVDILPTAVGIGYKVGYTDNNEWLKYTVQVAAPGQYTALIRTATGYGNGQLQLAADGANLSGVVNVPQGANWDDWKTVTLNNVPLTAGSHVLQMKIITGGFDFSSLQFIQQNPLLVNGALTGSGSAPTNWGNWNDGSHDPDTMRYRSLPNSWAFWWDGGIFQDVSAGVHGGDSLTFGGYLYVPSWDRLRNGTKYGILQLEFRDSGNNLISTASAAPTANSASPVDTWFPVSATVVMPSNAVSARLVIRCNDFSSGDGRFMADDAYLQDNTVHGSGLPSGLGPGLAGKTGSTSALVPAPTATSTPGLRVESGTLVIYPVPARDKVTFAYQVPGPVTAALDIYNLAGEHLAHMVEEQSAGNGQTRSLVLDSASLAPGIYFSRLQIKAQDGAVTTYHKKFAITK